MSESATPNNTQENYDDEISLKELILKLQEFWYELWRNWWVIILLCIPFVAYNLYQHFTFEKSYTASLTFMVNEDEGGGGLSGVSGVLGSFGLGGGAGGDYNLEKMLSLLKSRKIIQKVILSESMVDNQKDYFANHFIKVQDLHAEWSEINGDIDLNEFIFRSNDMSTFDLTHNTALKSIHSHIIGNTSKGVPALLKSTISEDTGIMELTMETKNEQLSINILESMFGVLSKYYVDKSTEKQQNTFDVISAKADSLQGELRSAEYALANFMDRNRGLYNRKDQLEQLRLEAKVKMLGTAFAKVVEQKEIAEFSLNDQTPVVQIIDYPISPIEPSKSSLIKNLIIALLIGGFLGAAFIIGRKIIRDALV